MRHPVSRRPQIGLLEPVAATIAVSEPVEGWHARSGPSTFDDHDQILTVQRCFAQVGAIRHLGIHLATIARPAMAGLAACANATEPESRASIAAVPATSARLPRGDERHR